MNWDQVKGQWKKLKGEAQRQWGRLTNDDFKQIEGDWNALVGRIQERYGIVKEEAERQVNEFEKSFNN